MEQREWEEARRQFDMVIAALGRAGCQDVELAKVLFRKLQLLLEERLLHLGIPYKKISTQPVQIAEISAVLERLLDLCTRAPEKEKTGFIPEAVRYIKANYVNDLSLSDVARHFNVTPEHFSRIFKREIGENFVAYLTNYRLNQAERLLTTTNLKISEVAQLVGYRNVSYFSKQYKRYIGERRKKR